MRPEEIVAELRIDLDRLRDGIAFLETGNVKFTHNNQDVTADWIDRQKGIAEHLEQLIEKYSGPDA